MLWFDEHRLYPRIVGEFDDSALMKTFGQSGAGIFIAPSVIEQEVEQLFGVEIQASGRGRDRAVLCIDSGYFPVKFAAI